MAELRHVPATAAADVVVRVLCEDGGVIVEDLIDARTVAAINAEVDGYVCTQDSCDPLQGCVSTGTPATTCLPAAKATFAIKDNVNDLGDQLKLSWKGGPVLLGDLGDPTQADRYELCIYDASGVRTARPLSIVDEVYTFNETSWVRGHAHVLTSIDYAKMPAEIKAQEPAPQRTDHDYALSYIQREGQGRVFVLVLGHDESIYKLPPMLAHLVAGVQYALGDLQADDSPSGPSPH
jgi:hypothetical protein